MPGHLVGFHNQEKLLVSGGRGQMCASLLQGTGCSTTRTVLGRCLPLHAPRFTHHRVGVALAGEASINL